MSKPLVKAVGIRKSYRMGRSWLRVLRGVNLSVDEGEFLAVMGASGSGKSTLLHILGALDVPDDGDVYFKERNVFALGAATRDRVRNRTFGFVFQFYHLLPELNVLENVLLPRMIGSSVLRYLSERREARRKITELLGRVGLAERMKHRPNELSGGEMQRAAIARALCNEPPVLLADEPTGNLDSATGAGILEVLLDLNQAGQTIVMVTHDRQVAVQAHRIVHLADGVIAPRPAPQSHTQPVAERT